MAKSKGRGPSLSLRFKDIAFLSFDHQDPGYLIVSGYDMDELVCQYQTADHT